MLPPPMTDVAALEGIHQEHEFELWGCGGSLRARYLLDLNDFSGTARRRPDEIGYYPAMPGCDPLMTAWFRAAVDGAARGASNTAAHPLSFSDPLCPIHLLVSLYALGVIGGGRRSYSEARDMCCRLAQLSAASPLWSRWSPLPPLDPHRPDRPSLDHLLGESVPTRCLPNWPSRLRLLDAGYGVYSLRPTNLELDA